MTNDRQWQDRIIETREGDPLELIRHAHPQNWKHHPESQGDALEAAINEVGMVARPLFNVRTGRFLDGHLRLKRAVSSGQRSIKYDVVDLSEEEERLVLATLDPVIRLGEPDAELYAELAAEIGEDFPDLNLADFWPDGELEEMLAGLDGHAPPEDPGPQIDRAAELREKWGVEVGQVWQLGEHRVVCGDCTDPAVVEAVMRGEKAELWITDPPYGVSYADKNKWLNAIARGNRIQEPIENDHLSMEALKLLWAGAAKSAYDVTTNEASYYWFACQGGDQMMMMMMMIGKLWRVRHELIWLKNNHVLGRVDYNYKHEPILFGWKRDGTHKFYGGFQTSVLEFDKPQRSELHPTTKPVELILRLVTNSSLPDQVVLDTFLGSGTTLIACEQLGRRARGIEIEPGYVAVTLERWQQATGRQPQLC